MAKLLTLTSVYVAFRSTFLFFIIFITFGFVSHGNLSMAVFLFSSVEATLIDEQ